MNGLSNLRKPARLSSQHGAALLVALIMLVLLTMLALTSFNTGKSDLQIVGNMQQRNEAENAGEEAVEYAISNSNFTESPNAVFGTGCNGDPNLYCVDKDGNGTPEVKVKLTPSPTCIVAKTVKNKDLDVSNSEDLKCATGQSQAFGTVGAATGDSLCADSTWEVDAQATDDVTQAEVNVTQGVSVRVPQDDVATSCP